MIMCLIMYAVTKAMLYGAVRESLITPVCFLYNTFN